MPPKGEAPFCGCGCGQRVKPSARRRSEWCVYASRSCSGRGLGRSNKGRAMSENTKIAHRRAFLVRWHQRYADFRAALGKFKQGLVTADAMIHSLSMIEKQAYERGHSAWLRKLRAARADRQVAS